MDIKDNTAVLEQHNDLTVQHLCHLPPSTTRLVIKHCRSTQWKEVFDYLEDHLQLRTLEASDCQLTSFELGCPETLQQIHLGTNSYNLDNNDLQDAVTYMLRRMPKLRVVSLSIAQVIEVCNSYITGRSFIRLCRELPQLTELKLPPSITQIEQLSDLELTQRNLALLCRSVPNLTKLELESRNITSDLITRFVVALPNLNYLMLGRSQRYSDSNFIGRKGLKVIAERLSHLQSLSISKRQGNAGKNPLEDEAFYELSDCHLTNEAAKHIALSFPCLQQLHLRETLFYAENNEIGPLAIYFICKQLRDTTNVNFGRQRPPTNSMLLMKSPKATVNISNF